MIAVARNERALAISGELRQSRVVAHEIIKDRRQIMQPVEMSLRQLLDYAVTFGGQPDAHDPAVIEIGCPLHHPGPLSTVDEFHRAVRSQQQVGGEIADRRRVTSRVPLDRDKQLILDVSQAGSLRLVFAPSLEPAQGYAEVEQPLEVLLA